MSLVKSLICASDRLVEFQTYLDSRATDDYSVHVLQIQKEEIVRLWTEFRSAVLDKYDKLKEEISHETVSSRYFSTFDVYTKLLSSVNELICNLSKKAETNAPVLESYPDHTPHISVPPCDTEIFDGNYKSWPTFRDMFTALYGNNKRLSPVEKMCHLLKKTQGEARELLKTCPITNDGFDMAWKNLMHRYENKRVLVNAQLKSLFNISPILKETGPNIRRLQRTINDCVTNLSLLKIDTNNWDIIFVYICSTCLPDVTLSLWEQSLPHSTNLPTWKGMDDFLTSRFQTLESVADIRSTFANSHTPNANKSNNFKKPNLPENKKLNSYSTNVTNNSEKCVLCHQLHPLRLCPSFLGMSIENRFNLVKQQKRCTNCLGTSHEYKQCKSKFLCNICKKKHHSLLHRYQTNSTPNQPRAMTQNPPLGDATSSAKPGHIRENHPPQQLNTTPSTSKDATTRELQSYSTQLQSPSSSVILGTALVDVYNDDIKCTVRALIDSASEATFISKKLQMKLGLRTRPLHVDVHGLSDSLTATSTQICNIKIGSPVDKLFETRADAFVVKKLTGQLPYSPPPSSTMTSSQTFNSLIPIARPAVR